MTLDELRSADGYCPECQVDIDLAEYYPELAEERDTLATRLAEAEAWLDEVATLCVTAERRAAELEAVIEQRNGECVSLHARVAELEAQVSEYDRRIVGLGVLAMKTAAEKPKGPAEAMAALLEEKAAEEWAGHPSNTAELEARQGEPAAFIAKSRGGFWLEMCLPDQDDDRATLDWQPLYYAPPVAPEVVGLVEALKPFAEFIAGTSEFWSDERRISTLDYDFTKLRLGLFRKAQTALAAYTQAKEGE